MYSNTLLTVHLEFSFPRPGMKFHLMASAEVEIDSEGQKKKFRIQRAKALEATGTPTSTFKQVFHLNKQNRHLQAQQSGLIVF